MGLLPGRLPFHSSPFPRRHELHGPNALACSLGNVLLRDVLFRVVTIGQCPPLANHHRVEVLAVDEAYRNQPPIPVLGVAPALDGAAPDMLKKECGGGSPAKEVSPIGVLARLLQFRRVDPKQPDAGSPDAAVPLALAVHNQRVAVRYARRAGNIGMGAGKVSNATRAAAVHFNAVMWGWYTASL